MLLPRYFLYMSDLPFYLCSRRKYATDSDSGNENESVGDNSSVTSVVAAKDAKDTMESMDIPTYDFTRGF